MRTIVVGSSGAGEDSGTAGASGTRTGGTTCSDPTFGGVVGGGGTLEVVVVVASVVVVVASVDVVTVQPTGWTNVWLSSPCRIE